MWLTLNPVVYSSSMMQFIITNKQLAIARYIIIMMMKSFYNQSKHGGNFPL